MLLKHLVSLLDFGTFLSHYFTSLRSEMDKCNICLGVNRCYRFCCLPSIFLFLVVTTIAFIFYECISVLVLHCAPRILGTVIDWHTLIPYMVRNHLFQCAHKEGFHQLHFQCKPYQETQKKRKVLICIAWQLRSLLFLQWSKSERLLAAVPVSDPLRGQDPGPHPARQPCITNNRVQVDRA